MKKIIVLSIALTISLVGFSFGSKGHRAIAEIAEQHLTRKAKKKIQKLLEGETMVKVSTYADEIRSDQAFAYTFPWHYVNMPLDKTYEESPKAKGGDLVTAYARCIEVLESDESTHNEKQLYLKLLIHFMADAHQPMHVGQKEDKGGNTIQVRWFDKGTNLHRVWDSDMLDSYGMTYSELAKNMPVLSKEQKHRWETGEFIDWIHETHAHTKKVYDSVEVGEELKYRYNYLYLDTLLTQVHKAGIRLAKVLNTLFK